MTYLQHGNRHRTLGSDPIQGMGIANDWVTCQGSIGTVTSGAEANLDMAGTIVYQTDSGTVYGVVAGTIAAIGMFELGSYLIRAKATFAEGKIGYVNVNAVTAGPCTLYNWDDNETFQAASIPDTTGGTDMGKYGGLTVWQQVCVVNNLSAPTTSYINFTNQTTLSLTSVVGYLQILRLT